MSSAEQKKQYQVIKQFKGVNTKANRTAIDDSEFSWLENAMPIGYGNLKITPSQTSLGITFTNTVTYFFSANIGLKDYLIAFEIDGSAEYVDLSDKTLHTMAPAGTFSSEGMTISQWKNEKVLIADPTKGYFTWDGTNVVIIGSVGVIGVLTPGSGYTSAPTVQISAPDQPGGVQALATAVLSGATVGSIVVTEAGSGYTANPTITMTGGGGTGATAVAQLATFEKGTVSVIVTNGGSGYTNVSNTVVTITSSSGTGAAGRAILSGGKVVQVIMTNTGHDYTNTSNVVVTITGGAGSNATAKAIVNTDELSGVQSFSGRVWIAQGRTVSYSAAGSVSDFASVSAGTIVLADATLHGNIISILSANNFLYVFGDDSINVFSDVRVTNAGTTLFTNTNVSASVGTKLKYAVFPYFRSILFMNDYGVYALVGSTTTKISDPLDGIFPDIDFVTEEATGGQVLLNNILCAAFNFKYTGGAGTSTANRYIQGVFFDKKWFFTSQGNNIKYVTSAPISGRISMFGTDGTSCVQLYADSTSNINSYVQTALMHMDDPIRTKQATKFGIEATIGTGGALNVTVDSELGSSPVTTLVNTVNWVNNLNVIIPWANNFGTIIDWSFTSGYALYKSDAKQWGKYLGLTIQSQAPAFVYNTYEFEHELRTRF